MRGVVVIDELVCLQVAVDVGRLGAMAEDERALLHAAAEVLHERLGFSAVQFYTVEAMEFFGVLRYYSGVGNRDMMSETPVIVQISDDSVVGGVLDSGEGLVLAGVDDLPRNAVPDGSGSGVVLPLVVGGQTLGAVVLCAAEADAFTGPDLGLLGPLADMLGQTLRLVQAQAADVGRVVEPVVADVKLVTSAASEIDILVGGEVEGEVGAGHKAAILLRGEVIGSLTLREEAGRELEEDELELIDSVAEQVAQAIDNVSLMEGMQRVAMREQLINDISSQLQGARSVEDVLMLTARAVRGALGNVEVAVRLSPEVASEMRDEMPLPIERGDTVASGEGR